MITDLMQFSWSVSKDGHRIRTCIPTRSRSLSEPKQTKMLVEGDGPSYERESYPVLDRETGLFRIFADTPPTESGALEFANRYGLLGGQVSEPIEDSESPTGWSMGERVTSWFSEIDHMRNGLKILDFVNRADLGNLSRHFHWRSDHGAVIYQSSDNISLPDGSTRAVHSQVILDVEQDAELIRNLPEGDVLMPAQLFIQQLANKKLRDHEVHPRLLWNHPTRLVALKLYISPNSLIGALWTQFAQAIDGKAEFGRCEVCRRWFEFTKAKRRGAKYCSDACRSQNYRNKSKRGG